MHSPAAIEALDGMRMKKGAGRVEGDDMLLVVEKVVVRGPHTPQRLRISEWIHF
jgi:hypothetical protein